MISYQRIASNPLFRQPKKFFQSGCVIGWNPAWRLATAAYRQDSTPIACRLAGRDVFLRPDSPDVEVVRSIFFEKEFKPLHHPHPRVIVDAGAHIGIASLYFSQRYPDAAIFALEPEADNFRLLQKNTASSPNIQCLQAALWHEEGEMEIHDRHKGNWSYSLVDMKRHSAATGQTTPCLTVPSLLRMVDGNRIDILKLDIEGAEKVVFDHAAKWIDRVEVIGVELHDRIAPGCTDAFRKAVSGFDIAQGGSEKWIAHQRGEKKESD